MANTLSLAKRLNAHKRNDAYIKISPSHFVTEMNDHKLFTGNYKQLQQKILNLEFMEIFVFLLPCPVCFCRGSDVLG